MKILKEIFVCVSLGMMFGLFLAVIVHLLSSFALWEPVSAIDPFLLRFGLGCGFLLGLVIALSNEAQLNDNASEVKNG